MGGEALGIILNNLPIAQEKTALKELKKQYCDYFGEHRDKLYFYSKLKRTQGQYNAMKNACDFSQKLNYDFLSKKRFINWIENLKKNNYKVSVLKIADRAGEILKEALEQNKIEIMFQTPKADINTLTDEEWQLCRKADIIISANIHGQGIIIRDGRKGIRITDIIKEEKA